MTETDPIGGKAAAVMTLKLLSAVEEKAEVTQRTLAARVGGALGLTNALLKRCVRKGLMKMSEVPARRYTYYLTPRGFQEKSRLVSEYLSCSLDFFRDAKGQYSACFSDCLSRGWSRLLLYGGGELAEIAVLGASDLPIQLVGIVDERLDGSVFRLLPVISRLADAPAFDAVVLTDTTAPQTAFDRLIDAQIAAERIITPPLLHVSRAPILLEPDEP